LNTQCAHEDARTSHCSLELFLLDQRVRTREEGRSPRLPATGDKKVQWVEAISGGL
jgi:hypothetical protein